MLSSCFFYRGKVQINGASGRGLTKQDIAGHPDQREGASYGIGYLPRRGT